MDRFFDEELNKLRSDLTLMGRKSVELTRQSMRALIENQPDWIEDVIQKDEEIDELNKTIDADAIRFITLRSPVARDVRLITVVMKCSREIERVADEAVSIGKRSRQILEKGGFKDYYNLPKMTELCTLLLNDALDTFTEHDLEKARELPQRDKEVDRLNKDNYNLLNECIINDRNASEPAVGMMFISKSLERVGDHAANIAEEVVYLLEGEDIRHTEETKHSTDNES